MITFREVQNKKEKEKRATHGGEDLGSSKGSQGSGSAIGATQLGQTDLLKYYLYFFNFLIFSGNERKRRDSTLLCAPENKNSIEKVKTNEFDENLKRVKRQGLSNSYGLRSPKFLSDIIMPYRRKRRSLSEENKERATPEGANVPAGIP